MKDVGHPHPAGLVRCIVGNFDIFLPVGVGPRHHPWTEKENGELDKSHRGFAEVVVSDVVLPGDCSRS